MSKDSFVFYTKYKDALLMLSDADRSEILLGCIEYVSTGAVPSFINPAASLLFSLVRQDIEEDKRKYEEVCEKRRKNVQKRWNTDGYNSIQMNTNEYKSIQKHTSDTDKDKDKDKEKDKDKDMDMDYIYMSSPVSYMDDRKTEMKKQISDLTKITLSRMGGAS